MRRTTEPMVEKYKGHTFEVHGIDRWVCDTCGNDDMSAEMADKWGAAIARERARIDGLLTPQEIRDIRHRAGLTQAQLEKVIGVSSPTVSRWETGAMLPSGPVCKLLRVLDASRDAKDKMLEMAEIKSDADQSYEVGVTSVEIVGDDGGQWWGSDATKSNGPWQTTVKEG